MTVVALVVLRLPAATIIALAGIKKLATYPHSARGAWWPGRRGIPSTVLLVASGIELVIAGVVLLGPAAVAIPTTVVSLGVLTVYGLLAIKNTGRCGCAGDDARSTPERLMRRNGALLAGAVGGEVLAPTVSNALLHAVGPIVGFSPAAVLIGMAAAESYRRRVQP